MKKHTIVFVRHGESEWNHLNLFTGWYDCGLSPVGFEEATKAGKSIRIDLIHINVNNNEVKLVLNALNFLSGHITWFKHDLTKT